MKQLIFISGVTAVLFFTLFATGWANTDNNTSGLNAVEHFNAAQTAYQQGDYEQALTHYELAADCVDKYLNAGNIYYKSGGAAEDPREKAQLYTQAMQLYMKGIIQYPQDVPLKFNYETVKALLDDLMEDVEEMEDVENTEDTKENAEQGDETESAQNGEQSEEAQDEGSQDEETQDGESQDGESQDGESQDGESQDGEIQKEETQNAEQRVEQSEEQDATQNAVQSTEQNADAAAIARILEMLESQEEESLKNNQGMIGGKDEGNGW